MIPTGSEALWYATRASGLVSLLLLTAVMVLGVQQVHAWAPGESPRFVTAIVHKNVSLLAVAFLAAHIATAVLDGFAPIGWIASVVPFSSPYRLLWLGLGTLAFDLFVALIITSLLRQRLGYRSWRLVHWIAYGCWPIAVLHGLGTGSDGTAFWVLAVNAACIAAVVGAIAWRLAEARQLDGSRRAALGFITALATILLGVWTMTGPAQAGWARKAGTPADLLASGSDPSSSTTIAPAGPPTPAGPSTTAATPGAGAVQAPFTASLDGTLTQRGGGASTTVIIDATLSPTPNAALHVQIDGQSDDGRGVTMKSSSVTLGPANNPQQFRGELSSLRGTTLVATLSAANGDKIAINAQLEIGSGGSQVTGTISGTTPPSSKSGPTR